MLPSCGCYSFRETDLEQRSRAYSIIWRWVCTFFSPLHVDSPARLVPFFLWNWLKLTPQYTPAGTKESLVIFLKIFYHWVEIVAILRSEWPWLDYGSFVKCLLKHSLLQVLSGAVLPKEWIRTNNFKVWTWRFAMKLWSCNFNSQLANALVIEGDFQGSISALRRGYNCATEICSTEFQVCFIQGFRFVSISMTCCCKFKQGFFSNMPIRYSIRCDLGISWHCAALAQLLGKLASCRTCKRQKHTNIKASKQDRDNDCTELRHFKYKN